MPQRTLDRLRGADDGQRGFTLIEVLVVVLIIGILAAIALPAFLGEQQKAQDADAKSDARNAVSLIDACLADAVEDDAAAIAACGSATNAELAVLSRVTVPGGTSLGSDGAPVYRIVSRSKSGHAFTIEKTAASGGGVAEYGSNPVDSRWNAS